MSAGRTLEEFWSLSPGQILHVLRALGLVKKKGTPADFARALGAAKGVRVRRPPDP